MEWVWSGDDQTFYAELTITLTLTIAVPVRAIAVLVQAGSADGDVAYTLAQPRSEAQSTIFHSCWALY